MHYQAPPGFRDELVEGELVLSPSANPLHGETCHRLTRLIEDRLSGGYVVRQDMTMCLGDEEEKGNRPRPDVLVMDQARWQKAIATKEYPAGSPQLAIEVLSPSTERIDREIKTPKYLAAGALLVWLFDVDNRTITTVWPDGSSLVTVRGFVFLPEQLGGASIAIEDIF